MTSRGVQEMLLLVEDGVIGLPFEVPYVPWTIIRALSYVRMIRNVYQRVAYDPNPENAVPLRHIWLNPKRVEAWFKQRKEDARRKT